MLRTQKRSLWPETSSVRNYTSRNKRTPPKISRCKRMSSRTGNLLFSPKSGHRRSPNLSHQWSFKDSSPCFPTTGRKMLTISSMKFWTDSLLRILIRETWMMRHMLLSIAKPLSLMKTCKMTRMWLRVRECQLLQVIDRPQVNILPVMLSSLRSEVVSSFTIKTISNLP